MESSTQARIGRPLVWLSVAVAGFLAFKLPTAWIAYSDRQAHRGVFLNFHPLFAIVYVPLAFGIIWPTLISILASAKQLTRQSLVWPAKTALIMFTVSACCAAPLVVLEYRSHARGVEAVKTETSRMGRFRDQQDLEERQALAELGTNGVASLEEPLNGPQTVAVNSYLDAHFRDPVALEKVSRRYRTSVLVMEHMSEMRSCPGEVLEILFDNAIDLQKAPRPPLAGSPYRVLYNLAWNPNLPVPILVRMLDNPDRKVRAAAAANPRLPEDAKVSYLKKAATSESFSERESVAGNPNTPPEELGKMLADENVHVRQAAAANPNTPKPEKMAALRKMAVSERPFDRVLAAQSPDCPPEELRALSKDPATAKYVAANPAAATDLLETLANSDDPETCRRAVANLTKRQKGGPSQ